MSLVTIAGGGITLMPMPQSTSSTPGISGGSSLLLDAASEQVAFIFEAPESFTLHKVGFLVTTVTSAPTAAHDIRVETVDAATGLSTGTLVATNTNGSATLNATGWYEVALTADASLTQGTAYAIVIKAPGANFGSINLSQFDDEVTSNAYVTIPPSGGSKNGINPIFALEDDVAVVRAIPGVWPLSAISSQAWNSSSNPNRRGARFKVPFPCRLAGCDLYIDADADYTIVFYASNGTTATTVYTGDDDIRAGINPAVHKVTFTTKPTLAADTYYRLIVLPSTVSGLTTFRLDVNAAKYLDAMPGGQNFHWTTVNGAPSAEGDWTQTLTSRPLMSLRFDQMDDGASSSGGARGYAFGG